MPVFSQKDAPVLSRELQRILQLCKKHTLYLTLGVSLCVLASSADLLMPLGLRELLDAVFKSENRSFLNRIALGLLALFIAQALASAAGRYLVRRTGEQIVTDLRKEVYAHLHNLSISYFNNENTGNITSRLTNDVSSIRSLIAEDSVSLLTNSFKLFGSITLMVMLNWRLSLLAFVVMPAAALLTHYLGKKIRHLSREVQDLLADTTVIAKQALSSIRVVKAFANTSYEKERYNSAVDNLFEKSRRRALVTVTLSSLITLTFSTALVAIFWFGGLEVLAARLSAGDLIAFVFYAQNVSQSVSSLSSLYASFSSAAGASSRLFELMRTESELAEPADAIELSDVRGRLEFENVTFGYSSDKPVLKKIDLTVNPGEKVALVGPSGTGKTTLFHLILRFFDPLRGRVLLDGHDLRSVRIDSLRKQVALVSQNAHLFDDTIANNIRYGKLGATDEEVKEAANAANAADFISSFAAGYETRIGEKGANLSGGQRQRIAIARALISDYKILLLDEATSSLDSSSEAKIQDALERLSKNKTTLTISHRLSTIKDANRILLMRDGKIVYEGNHNSLMRKSRFYRMSAFRQLRESYEDN